MWAPDQAKLVGWIWHPGYQSHFETPAGVLIPTCNMGHSACTKEEILSAEPRQIEINKRIDAKNKLIRERGYL